MSKEARMFDFTNGAKMMPSDTAKWIIQCVEEIRNGAPHYSISSGNSLVIAREVVLSHDPANPIIEVIEIQNGYIQHEFPLNRQPNSTHNTAIDQCIEAVKEYNVEPFQPLVTELISKLNNLKK